MNSNIFTSSEDFVFRFDLFVTKSQVTQGSTIGFESIIGEISLDDFVSVHTNSINSGFVSTNSTIGT